MTMSTTNMGILAPVWQEGSNVKINLLAKHLFVISMGKKRAGELAGGEILGVFSVSCFLMVCRSVFFLEWGLADLCHSDQHTLHHTLPHTVYSTREHDTTILSVSDHQSCAVRMSACLIRRLIWKTVRGQFCFEQWETYNRNSSDSNVTASWLSVVVTMLYGKNGTRGSE